MNIQEVFVAMIEKNKNNFHMSLKSTMMKYLISLFLHLLSGNLVLCSSLALEELGSRKDCSAQDGSRLGHYLRG